MKKFTRLTRLLVFVGCMILSTNIRCAGIRMGRQPICPLSCNWQGHSLGTRDHHEEVARRDPHTHMHTHTHTPTVHTVQNNRLQKTGACTSTTTQVDSCVHQSPVMNIITPATNRLCTVEGTTHYIIQQVSICHKNIQTTQLTDNYLAPPQMK